MYRDLPSGIRRLPRSLSSILVQGAEYKLDASSQSDNKTTSKSLKKNKNFKVQIGIASCTNARNTYVGEAWSVSNNQNIVQLGILDSRENRAFDSLNSPELNRQRDWNQLSLAKFRKNINSDPFLFSSYVKGRGSYSAVTPSSIIASRLAAQSLELSDERMQRNRVIPGAQNADTSFCAFGADLALREELLKASKVFKQQQQQQQSTSSSCSPMFTGCRGVWADMKILNSNDSTNNSTNDHSQPLIKLEVHNVGDSRALLLHNKHKKHIGTSDKKPEPSAALQKLVAKQQELPEAYAASESLTAKRQVDNLGIPLEQHRNSKKEDDAFDRATEAFHEIPSAMHPKLLHRRLRIDPVSIDHRPFRPEEARRIGRAAMLEDKERNSHTHHHRDHSSPSSVSSSSSKSANDANVPRDIITEDELLRGDFAVDVSRAFGHFHFKNCQQVAPHEQMLSCKPETVTRHLEVGDVLVLGNKSLFSPSTANSARFMGGWGVTLDSIAAHVIEEFEGGDNKNSAHDVARDLVQLSLLSGAEHNLSVVVMRVMEENDDEHVDNNSSFIEYPIVGEVHPYLLNNNHPQSEVYSHALRKDAWRLGFKTLGEFAEARGATLSASYQNLQETLAKYGGSKEKPSIKTPLDLWQGGLARDVCSSNLLMTHPVAVSNLVREMQAEMDWCEKEAKRQ